MKLLVLLMISVSIANASPMFDDYVFPDYTRTPLGDSIDLASMKILKETYDQSADKNVVSSPLGVLTLLSLYASGSEGKNQEEIMTLLSSTDYKKLSESYSELSQRFASMDPSYLVLANKIFLSDKFTLNKNFLDVARGYRTELDNVNFADQTATAEAINAWSSEKTRGMIDHPISESDLDPAAALALVNVIFFQGHWHVPFNASETKDKEFNLDRTASVKKPMMHLLQTLHYHKDEDLGAQMIELPYKETKFRMVVVLPDEVDGLPQVLEKVSRKGLLDDVFKLSPAWTTIDLDMPKFETRSKINLNSVLPKVGISGIFENAANGIINDSGVTVSKALQEAFVKVDEEGATAGAFTGLVAVPMSSWSRPPPPMPFKVDRPFLYAILHDDIVLFAGTYTH